MSAYGAISRSQSTTSLSPTLWKLTFKSPDANQGYMALFHLTHDSASKHKGLVSYMHEEFADEVERGDTYPQETIDGSRLTQAAFESYFFAADVILGLTASEGDLQELSLISDGVGREGKRVVAQFDDMRRGRDWKDCVAGFYYVKPNYPGRSSHICNAGFVVPFSQRGKGYSRILARSYLHYGPQLGYQASVFNLVYVNNVASIRLWEQLNFTKAGRIPKAGRLKRKDGQGEEYVDAWVFYKSFAVEEQEIQKKSDH